MQWQVFQWLFGLVIPPLNTATNAAAGILSGWVSPMILAGLVVYGAGSLVWGTLSGSPRVMERLLEVLVGGTIAIVITGMATYGPLVRNFVLVELIQGAGSALAGIAQGPALTAQIFDQTWLRSFASGLAVLRNAPWSMAGLGLVVVVIMFWATSAVAIGIAFGIWMRSVFMASVLLGFGPIFVGLFAFPSLRRLWWGWVNTVLANVALCILVSMVMVVLIQAETVVLTQLLQNVQVAQPRTFFGVQPAVNEWQQAGMLFGGMLIAAFMAFVALNLPGMAASITHGFSGFGHFNSMVMAAIGGVGAMGSSGSSPQQQSPQPQQGPPPHPGASLGPAPGPSLSSPPSGGGGGGGAPQPAAAFQPPGRSMSGRKMGGQGPYYPAPPV